MLNQKLYTVADVAELTGLTSRTIRNYLKEGTLHGKKIGVQWRFTEEDINALFLETQAICKRMRTPEELVTFFLDQKGKKEDAKCVIYDFCFPNEKKREEAISWWEQYKESNIVNKGENRLNMIYAIDENCTLRVVIIGNTKEIEQLQLQYENRDVKG